MIVKGYIISVLYALLCLALAFVIYKCGTAKKVTRKIVHILVGFEWVILYHFVGPSIHFLAICLLFTLLLFVTHRKNLMPMISSEGDNAPGTVYYGIAMTVMATVSLFIPNMIIPFGVGVFCTSFGDGLAGVVGQCIRGQANPQIYGKKSLLGSLTNFAVCTVGIALISAYFGLGFSVWQCLAIATLATELELFTGRGLDNITITLGASFLTYSFINFSSVTDYLFPILATPLMIAFAYSKKALTPAGILAAIVLDIIISVSLGNFGFAILIAFFIGGIATDKIKKTHNKHGQKSKEQDDCRNAIQVLANGIVPAVCAALYLFFDNRIFVIAFVASLAEALADTTASSFGSFAKNTFDPFRMQPTAKGLSGGMSLFGTFASVVGALFIAIFSFVLGRFYILDSVAIISVGFLGSVFDSLLGSLAQAKYRCTICGSIVECDEHCGAQTVKYRGVSFINNNTVNLLSSIFAAAITILIYNL